MLDRFQSIFKRSTDFIHFIDVSDTRNLIFIGLTPNSFRLSLNASITIKNHDGTIQNTERALNFGGKIDVSGSIDNINTMIFPKSSYTSRLNGNPPLSFLGHGIGGSSTGVNRTNFVNVTGVKQKSFSGSGFTSIDMGDNTNISNFVHGDGSVFSDLNSFRHFRFEIITR